MKSILHKYGKAGWFLLVLVFFAITFYIIDFQLTDLGTKEAFWKDIYFESHSIVFDLMIFGVVLSIYESFKTSTEKIKENTDKLDVHKLLDSKISSIESTHLIKEINRLGHKKFDLSRSQFYQDWTLEGLSFKKSEFKNANLKDVIWDDCTIKDCDFTFSSLEEGLLLNCSISNCDFKGSNLDRTRVVDKVLEKGEQGFEKWLKKSMTKTSMNWFKSNYKTQNANRVNGISTIRIVASKPIKEITKGTLIQYTESNPIDQTEKYDQSYFDEGDDSSLQES